MVVELSILFWAFVLCYGDEGQCETDSFVKIHELRERVEKGEANARFDLAQALQNRGMRDPEAVEESLYLFNEIYLEAKDTGSVPEQISALKQIFESAKLLLKDVKAYKAICDLSLLERNYFTLRECGFYSMLVGEKEDATKLFREAIKYNKTDAQSYALLGFSLSPSEEAIEFFLKAFSIDQNTKNTKYFLKLGDCYLHNNRKEEAENLFKEGFELGLFKSKDQRPLYRGPPEIELRSQPWWTPEEAGVSGLIKELEKNWKQIKLEISKIQTENYVKEKSLTLKGEWKEFILFSNGNILANCLQTPKTCEIIKKYSVVSSMPMGQVKFSRMVGGTKIMPHTGTTDIRLRAHLGISIIENSEIKVGGLKKEWEEGKVLIFDDSFEHEVSIGDSEEKKRIVLIFDLWHPDVPVSEREKVYQFIKNMYQ